MKDLSFAELLELKNNIGVKDFNDAIGMSSRSAPKGIKRKGHDLEKPSEFSSKKPVPLLGKKFHSRNPEETQTSTSRDPRFDQRCGEYNDEHFRTNFDFAYQLRDKELKKLKTQLEIKNSTPEEKKKMKFLIQRMDNQNREYAKKKTKIVQEEQKRDDIKKARNEGRNPYFLKKNEERAMDLVKKYEDLKSSGGLEKHLEKRRKKHSGKDKKRLNL